MAFVKQEFELKFEYILYNHLRVFSEAYAYQQCDYDSMARMYEQYAMSKMTREQRGVLRAFKLVMSELEYILRSHYNKELKKFKVKNREYEDLLNERDAQLAAFRQIYHNFLLRWAIACTNKEYADSWNPYYEWEFFTDLLIELVTRIEVFDEKLVKEVFEEYGVQTAECYGGSGEEPSEG